MERTNPATLRALEVACDESGWEGSNLATGRSDVIAYASVRLSVESAAERIQELRGRAGHPAAEYKASHLLRADRRSAVTWLLGPGGALGDNARVHLTEKAYFVVGRVLDLVLGCSADAATAGLHADERVRDMALVLCREGPALFGDDRWRGFLVASNRVLRTNKPRDVREPVDAFVDLVEVLHGLDGTGRAGAVLAELRRARSDAYAARAALLERRVLQPALEPLIPALARTILHWTRSQPGVSVVHDEQSALTKRRMEWLEQRLPPRGRFVLFRQVDSRSDPRVQVADLLAGVARRVAADELHGRRDAELGELLRPYVDPTSRWSDQPSWARLGPVGATT